MNWLSVKALLYNHRFLLAVYAAAALITSLQLYLLGPHLFVMPSPGTIPADIMNQPQYMAQYAGRWLTQYNNYTIFKCSWFHLLHGTNLYGLYPAEHWDFYKYSPTFALCMSAFAYLPDAVGLSVWNLLNAVTLLWAIRMLPFGHRIQCLILWLILNELLTCLTNCQSNGLMCALLIAAFACMQRQQMIWAALWLVLATYIKVYGAIGCCLFLFFPGKLRFAGYCLLWTVALAALPLLVTPPQTLAWQYHNWAALIAADAGKSTGLSVSGWLGSWFGYTDTHKVVAITGIVMFLIPFARVSLYGDRVYRLLMLASMLIWIIIFNHKAESPTYIVAITGVALWYFSRPAAGWRTGLLIFVLLFSSLSTTDIFPPYWRSHLMQPYRIKAVPCIVVWLVTWCELLRLKTAAAEKEITFPVHN